MDTDNRFCPFMRRFWGRIAIAVVLGAGLVALLPAQAADEPAFDEIVHLTCIEAWQASNQNVDAFVVMINVLAKHSLAARGLTFPDTLEAGERMGRMIDAGCRAAPENVLYNEVDKAVRAIAK